MKAGARSYLIGRRDLNPGWIGLYAATWVLQWFSWPFRYFGALGVLWLLNAIAGWQLPINTLALAIGFGPLALSLATLVYPSGGWWFEQSQGGRRPSERERIVFGEAFGELRHFDPEPSPAAALVRPRRSRGKRLCLRGHPDGHQGDARQPLLPAVLAHELGHLNSSDARVSAALYRITTPPRQPIGFPFRLIAFLISGRVGMFFVRQPWALYWRHREKVADAYAANLGQAQTLADYLDDYALEGDLPTPFKDFGETSHPWTEHRIEALKARSSDE